MKQPAKSQNIEIKTIEKTENISKRKQNDLGNTQKYNVREEKKQ